MTLPILILALVTLQRLGELWLSARNTARLKAQGAYEVGPRSTIRCWWPCTPPGSPRCGCSAGTGPFPCPGSSPTWCCRRSGPGCWPRWASRWTTRIIVLPGAPLVARGPYRFLSHPNYAVVIGEIFVLPMVFGLLEAAIVFSLVNALVLAIRIRAENAALRATER